MRHHQEEKVFACIGPKPNHRPVPSKALSGPLQDPPCIVGHRHTSLCGVALAW
ncbi:MAG: hypothetical protein GWN86_00585, partial [Desulfobacterales bacterium]|nr:hypothetical protein [Desulfobacterales bacterium]